MRQRGVLCFKNVNIYIFKVISLCESKINAICHNLCSFIPIKMSISLGVVIKLGMDFETDSLINPNRSSGFSPFSILKSGVVIVLRQKIVNDKI